MHFKHSSLLQNGKNYDCKKDKNFFILNEPLVTKKTVITGQNLGRVFQSRWGRACPCHHITLIPKQANLKLKT
jgi:hypothetical protein